MTRWSRFIHVGILLGLALVLMAAITTDNRAYTAGKFALELDGKSAGWLWSVEGGTAVAEVVNERLGPNHIVKKHIGQPKYEDITIHVGTGMSRDFYQWIQDTVNGEYARKSGAIIAADFSGKEQSRREFTNALITEIGMPALDAASKDAAYMTIKLSPETTIRKTSGAGSIVGGAAATQKAQKQWSPANFRLKLEKLDAASNVNKIDAFTIKQKVNNDSVGEQRDYQKEPASVEVPNLVITLAETSAQPFYDWHEDFVIKGNSGEDKERSGTLEFLTLNAKDVLFTLTFKNLGIFKLAPEKGEAGAETIKRVKAEMYVEQVTFDGSGAAGSK